MIINGPHRPQRRYRKNVSTEKDTPRENLRSANKFFSAFAINCHHRFRNQRRQDIKRPKECHGIRSKVMRNQQDFLFPSAARKRLFNFFPRIPYVSGTPKRLRTGSSNPQKQTGRTGDGRTLNTRFLFVLMRAIVISLFCETVFFPHLTSLTKRQHKVEGSVEVVSINERAMTAGEIRI